MHGILSISREFFNRIGDKADGQNDAISTMTILKIAFNSY